MKADRQLMPDETGLGDDWNGGTWFWLKGTRLYASMLMARKPSHGAFTRLREWCLSNGLLLTVPTPMGRMQAILQAHGFKEGKEWVVEMEEYVETWTEVIRP